MWIEDEATLVEYKNGNEYVTYVIYNNALRSMEKSLEPYSNVEIVLDTEGY